MAKRQTEGAAAGLLTAWTDVDTAMQIVGTSLGVFRPGPLDPTNVLAHETPLRNALFDILLSLVEGGALEIRVAADNRYAFRWREDIAVAGLAPGGSTSIDLAVPSPYLAELQRAQAERDVALGRAEVAEALAAEREHLLRLSDDDPLAILDEPPSEPVIAPAEATPVTPAPPVAAAAPKAARKPATKRAPKRPEPKAPEPEPAEAEPAPARADVHDVVYLTPPDAEPEPDLTLEPTAALDAVDGVDDVAVEEQPARRPKWSGYAIDRSRPRLTKVDRLVEDG